MKKIVSIILLSTILLTGVSCAADTVDDENNTANSLEFDFETTSAKNREPTPSINDIPNNTASGPKHYEFGLDINNFKTYLNYTSENGSSYGIYDKNYTNIISGVLTYAYYENVIVTFDVVYEQPYSDGSRTYTGEYSVLLNAAGNATFYADDQDLLNAIRCPLYNNDRMKKTFTIKRVSGKVIFSL